jgi:VIT1/CCC1 family predicted Fe2+/Mn2+ transporter
MAEAESLGRGRYMERGVEPNLARQVADQLMARDALGAHARDELGNSEATTARPVQAALTSASTFAVGAALPLSMVLLMPRPALVAGVSITSLVFLGLLGAIGARAGGGECRQGHPARHLLGRVGDGVDCGHRSDLRDGRLKRREEMRTVNE